MLERGEIHVAIALLGLIEAVKADRQPIETYELAPVEYLAASPKSMDLGAGAEIEIARLASVPLLLLDASFYVRKTFDAACRLAGVKQTIFMESTSPQALLALAE